MRGHVDTESLALYAEGLLSRRQSARIRSHLSGCPECAAVQQQLTGVTAMLGQVPAAPLPPAVASRLDLALTAEAARRAAGTAAAPTEPAAAGTPGGAEDIPGSPGHPGRTRRQARGRGHQPGPGGTGSRRRALRSPAALRLVSVAGAAVILAAGGYGLSRLISSPSSSSTSSAAAPHSAALPVFSSGTDYQPGTLGQQAATALTKYQASPARGAIQAGPAQGGTSAGNASAGSAAAGNAAAGSSADGGGHAVTSPATRHGADTLAPAVTSGAAASLRGCAAAVADGRTVELVDRASYAGQPAIIIVLAGSGSQPATVWVTGPGCSAGHPDKITEGPLGG